MKEDEKHIRRCIALAICSFKKGDWPFGALLVSKEGKILAEGLNTAKKEITGHAEINVVKKALEKNKNLNLSDCTLYSSFEPCPMCSFIIREFGIGRVVFSLTSPHWGGSSRWPILLEEIPPYAFAQARNPSPPEVIGGVLAEESSRVFEEIGWEIHTKKK